MLTEKECTNCYMTLSFFPSFISRLVVFINLLKPDVPSALKKRLFNKLTIAFQVSETLMRCTKELHFLNYCSHKINKFLIQNIDL